MPEREVTFKPEVVIINQLPCAPVGLAPPMGVPPRLRTAPPALFNRDPHPSEPGDDPLEALSEGVPPVGVEGVWARDGGEAAQAGAGPLDCAEGKRRGGRV